MITKVLHLHMIMVLVFLSLNKFNFGQACKVEKFADKISKDFVMDLNCNP
jgi:hypothetical protein